jgi:hypothetical protein
MLWLTVRLLTRLLVFSDADDGTKDLEILVLRHQLGVLRRKTGRPKFTHATESCSPPPAGCSPDSGGHRRSRHAPDTAALAPHPGPTQVDLQEGAHAGPATDRRRGRRAHPADGQGESPVGLRAELRRDAPDRAGRSFFEPKPRGSWPATCFTVETIRLKTL